MNFLLYFLPMSCQEGEWEWLGGHLTASQGQPTTPSNQQLSNWARDAVWDHFKGHKEVKIHYTSCSSLLHQHGHCITKGHWISQVWFALYKAMLLALNHFPVIHLPTHTFQEDMIHDIRHSNIWLVDGSQGPIFTLFKIRCDIFLFLGLCLTAMIWQIWWREAEQLHLPVSSCT